jgi:hypothetical protein
LFKHISSNAHGEANAISEEGMAVHDDDPPDNWFAQDLMTSGAAEAMDTCGV